MEGKHRGNKVVGGIISADPFLIHLAHIKPALSTERAKRWRQLSSLDSADLTMSGQHRRQRAVMATKVEHALKLPGHIFQPLNEMTRLPRFQERIIVIMTGRPVAIAPVKRPVEELGWSW